MGGRKGQSPHLIAPISEAHGHGAWRQGLKTMNRFPNHLPAVCFILATLFLIPFRLPAQIIAPGNSVSSTVKAISPIEPLLEHRVVTQEEMDRWPVDKKRSLEKLWAETTWGGDEPGKPKLFNWNTWPCRVVLRVPDRGEVVRAEVVWRRSLLSARLHGMKLIDAKTGNEIADARLVQYSAERITVDFRPASGPGVYYLYYGASEPAFFKSSEEWSNTDRITVMPIPATVERIEERCALDGFPPMEIPALHAETEALLAQFPGAPYLVFPEDRDRSIAMQHEIPAIWTFRDPEALFALTADKNEYRVFQVGIWACRETLENVSIGFGDFTASGGAIIPAARFQCLTTTSKIKSRYIKKPTGPFPVPKGEVRAFWCGIDLPPDVAPGEYRGTVTVRPGGKASTVIPVQLRISDASVEARGDNDLKRLSRLRWIESDVGLSDQVFPPYTPLKLTKPSRSISTWGHTLTLTPSGLPGSLRGETTDIMAAPMDIACTVNGAPAVWGNGTCRFTESIPARVRWTGSASSGPLRLGVEGEMEYDGAPIVTVTIESPRDCRVTDLTLTLPWRKDQAWLASGMGYRGKREGDRLWRSVPRERACFDPSVWLGSVKAGLGFLTWDTAPWEDASRMDAALVTEQGDRVVLRLNLGAHTIGPGKTWKMQFALRPTPVKPEDPRHWQFRYLHRGGGFAPGEDDTPQSYLKDNCKRLDELAALGVKRLNLHDWWGPAFNYAWQWDGPDNLSRLTAEAHKRGIRVKVYNSGRELSNLAPEFWPLLYEGTQYAFRDSIVSNPVGNFQDAWHENHLPDGLPQGWPRLHRDRGNEHTVPVSNATRNGNFYLESMRYMTENFGVDGAYWDGADGPTPGHREMAKRLWTMYRQTNPEAAIDAHHGTTMLESPVTSYLLVLPFIDSIWHGEGFAYDQYSPWAWLTEISGLPFNIPSEMLSGEQYLDRGMLFGIWPRMGWGAGTEKQKKLWAFFDSFGIEKAALLGFWEKNNGVLLDRADTYVSAFAHPKNGALLVVSTWHPPLQGWVGNSIDASLKLDRKLLRLSEGTLRATDILTGEELDIMKPVPLRMPKTTEKSAFYEYRSLSAPFEGRLIWVRGK